MIVRVELSTMSNSIVCIQHITNIPHSVITGDVNAHSTLWHSNTDHDR